MPFETRRIPVCAFRERLSRPLSYFWESTPPDAPFPDPAVAQIRYPWRHQSFHECVPTRRGMNFSIATALAVSLSRSASGTARQINPHSSAWAALTRSPSKAILNDRARPTLRGKFHVVPMSGTMPRFGPKVATKNALWPAMVISQESARPRPPPAAGPLTFAMVGTGQFFKSANALLK